MSTTECERLQSLHGVAARLDAIEAELRDLMEIGGGRARFYTSNAALLVSNAVRSIERITKAAPEDAEG